MRNARCCVSFAVVMLAASLLPGCGRGEKEAKPVQVALGMSTADVEAKLGKPLETAATPDGPTVWKYQEDQRAVAVEFEGGRVSRIVQAVVGDDAKEIQGTWKLVSTLPDSGPGEGTGMTFAFGGGKITPLEGPDAGESEQYRLDSSASPKTIDLIGPDAKVARGIYSLAGDDLKIYAAEPGAARPTRFESRPGSEIGITVLRRQSREWSHPVASKLGLKKPTAVEATGPTLVKVSGTVKFKDGSLIQVPADTGRAEITFWPADAGEPKPGEVRKGAQGKIGPDGRFEMYTIKRTPPDGVIPGKYKVTIVAQRNYTNPMTLILPQKYIDPQTSGLEVTIEKPKNDLQFELDLR
jgi:uncharacterized protein (TIGR03067 family)